MAATLPHSAAHGHPEHQDLSLMYRGLFAAIVVFWHVSGYLRPIPDALNVPGRTAVWMFFVLSGYVIGRAFFDARYALTAQGVLGYAIRRTMRIAPLFLFISLVAVALLLLRGEAIPFSWYDVPAQIFAVQWQHDYKLVGVFWTLGVEVQFYLLAPVLAMALLAAGRWWLALGIIFWVAVTLWPALSSTLWGTSLDDRTVIGELPHFACGMLVSRIARNSAIFNSKLVVGLCAVGGLAALSYSSTLFHADEWAFWNVRGSILTDAAAVMLLFVHVAVERRALPAGRLARLLMGLGVVSYGLYAWHGFLLTYFPWFSDQLAATFAASLVLAWLSFILLERPLIAVARARTVSVVPRVLETGVESIKG